MSINTNLITFIYEPNNGWNPTPTSVKYKNKMFNLGGWVGGWMDGCMGGWVGGWGFFGWVDGWMDGWMDG